MIDIRPSATRRAFTGLLAAAVLCPRSGLADTLDIVAGTAFGTSWRIVGPPGGGLGRLHPRIATLFDEFDRQMSPWRGDSTISRLNTGRAGWHPAEPELMTVTDAALDLARRSGGVFDPTVGPLVARWGFGPIGGGSAPDWRGLSLAPRGIVKARDDLTLDLCGIAKGRALDLLADLVQDEGHDAALLDLGGEYRAIGRHPEGRPWRVAVEPAAAGDPPPAVLPLVDGAAVATSGLRTQSYALGGRTYGHIMDPAAGAPADGGLWSVTVLADDAMTADGWATALFAAGPDDGPAMAEAHGIAALFLPSGGSPVAQIRTRAMVEALA